MEGVFGVVDYIIFCSTLGLSVMIGVYFGFFGSKQKSATEYLYGNGHMKPIPVGLSLYSSAVSALSIIGTPSEVYVFGTQFIMAAVGTMFSLLLTWNLVIPIFCGSLRMKTPYEYFELRFSKSVRLMSSFIYIMHTIIFMPIVLYASVLALSEGTGIPLLVCSTAVGALCMFYTMVGGFKSVIWTDTLQATLMMGSCFVVTAMGIYKVGGAQEVWNRADNGKRLIFFDMDPDPFRRISFWTITVGMCFTFCSHSGSSASTLQRYMSLAGEKQARISSFIGAIGFAIISIVGTIMGLCMYGVYHDCDPVKNEDITNSNQLIPKFILDTVGHIPGFSGFFIAGLLSGGLSTLSAEFNTTAGLIYHDFVTNIHKKNISEERGALIMKILVFILGTLCLISVPLLANSKNLFQFALSIVGFSYGAKLGILLLGTCFPTVNSKGALCGSIASMVIIIWITIGGLYYNVNAPYVLPISTEGCPVKNETITNSTIPINQFIVQEEPMFLYKLSFLLYPFLGVLIVFVVGLSVSYLTGPVDPNTLDKRLIAPFLHPYMKARSKENYGHEIKFLNEIPLTKNVIEK